MCGSEFLIFPHCAVEKEEILSQITTVKLFREINFLVKPLVSRNFRQKSVRHNAQCGKMKNVLSTKNFRQIISLVKPLVSRNFSRKIVRVNFCN